MWRRCQACSSNQSFIGVCVCGRGGRGGQIVGAMPRIEQCRLGSGREIGCVHAVGCYLIYTAAVLGDKLWWEQTNALAAGGTHCLLRVGVACVHRQDESHLHSIESHPEHNCCHVVPEEQRRRRHQPWSNSNSGGRGWRVVDRVVDLSVCMHACALLISCCLQVEIWCGERVSSINCLAHSGTALTCNIWRLHQLAEHVDSFNQRPSTNAQQERAAQ